MANTIYTAGALSLAAPGSVAGLVGRSWPLAQLAQSGVGYTQGDMNVPKAGIFTTVTAATNALPIAVTTAAPHGLTTGDVVTILGVTGNTNANGTYPVTVTGPSTFTIPVAGSGAYVSGGTVQLTCVPVPMGSVTQPGLAVFSNLDATNFVQLWCSNTFNYLNQQFTAYLPCCRIPPGGNQLVCLEITDGFFLVADTAPCYVEWIVLNS